MKISSFSFWTNQSYSISPACLQLMIIVKKLCSYIFKVCVYPVFDNLESGKRNFCFGKKVWKNSWILDPKICTNFASSILQFEKGIIGDVKCRKPILQHNELVW